jgi:hypothetical protein
VVHARFSFSITMIVLQLVAVTASLAAIALYPPARGTMLLVPVWPGAERALAARAIQAGARLVDRGPLANSLVISGDRAAIWSAMASSGVIAIAAPTGGCGDPA